MAQKKHAYMITAHKNDLTFYTLLSMLDHPRNDLYIHMDVNNRSFHPESVKQYVHYSRIYFVPRIHVVWAHYTLTYVKILELRTAIETGNDYAYYHFISGEDLPIQTQEGIHAFFDANQGKEFVNYEWPEFPYQNRIRYYYFFQDKAGRGRSLYKWFFRGLDRISVAFQKCCGVWRNPDVPFQKGEGWASITGQFGAYIWEHWPEGEKWFKNTIYSDEELFQTFVESSAFKDRLYRPDRENTFDSMMRIIDFKRGDPYVFRMSDWEELRDSSMCWARKFDARVDAEIIAKLNREYGKKE